MTLLTKRAAASSLAVTVRTVTTLCSSGRLPIVRIGRAVRIDSQDLAAFVAARKSQSLHRSDPSSPLTRTI